MSAAERYLGGCELERIHTTMLFVLVPLSGLLGKFVVDVPFVMIERMNVARCAIWAWIVRLLSATHSESIETDQVRC